MRKNSTTHFAKRCVERGIPEHLVDELERGIEWAIKSRRDDLVEKVGTAGDGHYWRFMCQGVVYYAVTRGNSHYPITVYTQAMYSQQRKTNKNRAKAVSHKNAAARKRA